MKKNLLLSLLAATVLYAAGCGNITETILSGGAETPYDKLGVGIFPGNRNAGDLYTQMADIATLKFKWVRATFWFDTQFMAYNGASPNYARFDETINAAAASGLEVVPILAYVPDWLRGDPNWKNTFVNDYVIPLVRRYKGSVKYWEVWNEPDEMKYDVLNGSAEDYFDLLKQVSAAIRSVDPSAKVVAAATTSIVTDGLAKFEWTQKLVDMGLSSYADVLNIHYYSDLDIELSANGGPLVTNAGMPVWVTETGKSGQGNQKSYFDSNMGYIDKSVNPERIFWYCYIEGEGRTEEHNPDETYGLLTYYGGYRYESSLYTHLKSR
ncbi:MAG: cellulase family glycosylhydrolase [Nitrospinae bacterium]|nr:cellulase family glycosylhydrolase [Nitrospinota bacterium]